jgi:hypothetical protein
MFSGTYRIGGLVLLVAAFTIGCSGKPADRSPSSDGSSSEAEVHVRAKFAEFQKTIKARDAGEVWKLLSSKSRADAEQVAKEIRTTYEQARPEEKAKREKALGLSGAELAKLTGPGFLKTRPFLRKYDEVTESKVDKVIVQGDNATVYWEDPEGDKGKTIFVREDGQWKAWLTMPKVKRP